MHFSELSTILLALSPVALASVIPQILTREDDLRDEAVYLSKCSIYVKGNDASPNGQSDRLLYFKNLKNSLDKKDPDDSPYAWGGSVNGGRVDYLAGTEEKPINGMVGKKEFKAWGLAKVGDKDTFVTGNAKLDGADFRCYTNLNLNFKFDYGPKMYQKCYATHYCTRSERLIRRTRVTTYEAAEYVTLTSKLTKKGKSSGPEIKNPIMKAFDSLKTHMEKKNPDNTGYTIGNSNSKLVYTVLRQEAEGDPYYEANRIDLVSKLLTDTLAAGIYKNETIHDCDNVPNRGGVDWTPCKSTFPFPKQITIQVQVAKQSMLDWDDRDFVKITTESDKTDCKADKMFGLISGLFGVASAVATGGVSAGLSGLGAVSGIAASGSC